MYKFLCKTNFFHSFFLLKKRVFQAISAILTSRRSNPLSLNVMQKKADLLQIRFFIWPMAFISDILS